MSSWLWEEASGRFFDLKAAKTAVSLGGNDLSRFSDPPRDALLDDLFHPLDKSSEDRGTEASTSASASHVNQGSAVSDSVKNEFDIKLGATIAQKQMEKETGGDLLRIVMGVIKDDAIDIDGLGFDEKLPVENLFPQQAVEFSRLVGSLRSDASEDVIATSYQKLISIFRQRPEQKLVFITQHGLLPLLELLDIPKTRLICSVLQLINQIVKDNTDFLENACHIGLIREEIARQHEEFAKKQEEMSKQQDEIGEQMLILMLKCQQPNTRCPLKPTS